MITYKSLSSANQKEQNSSKLFLLVSLFFSLIICLSFFFLSMNPNSPTRIALSGYNTEAFTMFNYRINKEEIS